MKASQRVAQLEVQMESIAGKHEALCRDWNAITEATPGGFTPLGWILWSTKQLGYAPTPSAAGEDGK